MNINYAGMVGKVFNVWSPRPKEWMPFSMADLKVRVRVIADYKTYIVCTVLPHKNPKGFSISLPYNITIDKLDIENRNIVVD